MKKTYRIFFFGIMAVALLFSLLAIPGFRLPAGKGEPMLAKNLYARRAAPAVNGKELMTEFSAGEEDDPLGRERWFWEQRALPLKTIPVEVHTAAINAELLADLNRPAEPEANNWQSLGPAPLNDITYAGQSAQDASGRALAVAVHPSNSNVILIGAAQGGIWRSINGGLAFTPAADLSPSLAIKVIRFAPSNPNILYAGTGEPHGSSSIYGQGVLKSTDGGLTWQALPSSGAGWDFRYASISGLQVHPTNPNTVFVTTAAISTVPDHFNPASTPQTGIFRSTDGGATWTLLKAATTYTMPFSGLQGNVGFMDLELANGNPNRLYASEYSGGIYRSDNGGSTWNLVTPVKASGAGNLPAAVPSFSYFSSQQGTFFVLNRFQYAAQYPEFYRIEMGMSQSNPDVLYAGYAVILLLDADGNGTFDQNDITNPASLLFKSTNGGSNWTWLGDWARDGTPDYCASQCDYDNIITVNPANPNDVSIGGSANYNEFWPDPLLNPTRYLISPWRGMVHRSLDGGSSWTDTTPHCVSWGSTSVGTFNGLPAFACSPNQANRVIHPDQHGIAYDPSGLKKIYVVNDGGFYVGSYTGTGNTSAEYSWVNQNSGLSTLQFYFFDVHPTDANRMAGGLQDNSVAYWDGASWEGWAFGDGTFFAFDPLAPQHVYMGTQFNIHRHDNGGAKVALDPNGQPANGWNLSIFSVQQGDARKFITPFEIDPVQSNIIYAASETGLYRSLDRGATWSGRLNTNPLDGSPTTISVSPVDHNLVWVGTSNGWVYLVDFNTNLIHQRGASLPGRYLSKIEASPTNANAVYATYSGYNANTPSTPGKVFVSTNLGIDFSNISGNLPDVPVSSFAVDPGNTQRMWVGSDTGVHMTTNGGTTWASYRKNMPVVAIMDMKYNASTDYLSVVTHGRGAWRINPDGIFYNRTINMPAILRNPGGFAPPVFTPTPTQQVPPTQTPTPTQPPQTLPSFVNANFESGRNVGWSESSTGGYDIVTNAGLPMTPHSGSWLAWLGGDDNEISTLSQSVNVPASVPPFYLRYYYQVRSSETICDPQNWADAALIYINNVSQGGYVLCTSSHGTQWVFGGLNVNLASYAGQTINVRFEVQTDSSLSSSFFLDDVSFSTTPPTARTASQDIPLQRTAPQSDKPPSSVPQTGGR